VSQASPNLRALEMQEYLTAYIKEKCIESIDVFVMDLSIEAT
jgi:hypothetical protein